ncbi:methyl-accepting chemotaxis sensory transducer [Catenovulum agarivorans DS-2]|uniref:Methyl-accepting chemotaxis sensory transducer n=1 Tax=Catenovulum agarivorans DS-2 TaxID=1328313 RepID=W7Q8P2_9ALTE|nr:methyl-accepting chemotaxis protein [Catenovulum agarivorans]EWH08366.1 methyl-accepting chemotaxis sensory transducer [Catenovulum agarivorans DS-2]
MNLKSSAMQLTAKEKSWLPWFGSNGKFNLGYSCLVNRSTYQAVEQTFEGIAATRVKILQLWAQNQWEHLTSLANLIDLDKLANNQSLLLSKLAAAPDFSELAIVNQQGEVVCSTYSARSGQKHKQTKALLKGLSGNFLHGPYPDTETLQIGPSTSKFHDEVTLMFYLPIMINSTEKVVLTGRVPNDVIGDLIQREAGHIYRESGDNYIFMVNSVFDPSLPAGVALSRSRFEDSTFSHGENLKSGIDSGYGIIRVKQHTEFEIHFTDPATGQLHPGVRETIRNGENLYVKYPGYSDYRHIPVIGKGVTFQIEGSPDTWGMMCEGDLEEVYRRRSINLSLMKIYLSLVTCIVGINAGLNNFSDLPTWAITTATVISAIISCFIFSQLGTNRVSNRLNEMTNVIRTIAEGEGNLTQRLDPHRIKHDETGDLSRWINSFIDNLDGIVGQVIHASMNVKETNENMLQRNEEAHNSSHQVHESMQHMQSLIQKQRQVILQASETAENMKLTMAKVVEKAKTDYQNARSGTQAIRDIVDTTASSVQSIDGRMDEIGNIINVITEITNQTNLLALNAAIEAARAGEHGRGFSVVADEVRGLAARTAEAAQDIQSMIHGLQQQTKEAVSFMESGVKDVDQSLKLTEAASSENQELHQIVERMFETISVIEQNSARNGQTAQTVTEVTHNMAKSISELATSSNLVDTTANKLQQLVGMFEVSTRR